MFGALLDTCPQPTGNANYIGGPDSFVFTLKPQMQGFIQTGQNDYVMLCAREYLNIGAQNEGPAIHLDNTFKNCSTYQSATFNNQLLTGRTEGRFLNDFQAQEIELFII